jgi:peptidoglycan/LPS O-acetylase OafA/YrhL
MNVMKPKAFSTSSKRKGTDILGTLNLLRYICAFSILIWHYQHFFTEAPGKVSPNFSSSKQPLYGVLKFFYDNGYSAVPMFWLLSGIVLSLNYNHSRKNSWREFLINRLARLYPLHIFSLLLVALLAVLSLTLNSQYEIYGNNTPFNFIGNIFLINDATNFNGPF